MMATRMIKEKRGVLGRLALSILPVLLLCTVFVGSAGAVLKAVGPTDLATTLPTYYQDTNNLALQPCLDQNGMCILTPAFDPAITVPPVPITTTGPITPLNFPDESFYFLADSVVPIIGGGTATLRLAFEAAFLTGVAPNGGLTFLRVNLKKMTGLTPNSVFTVTHPYGTFQFASDATGAALTGSGAAYRAEDLSAGGNYFTPDIQAGTHTGMGPFLSSAAGLIVDPISGHTYIGDPAVAVAVTGSPTGTNFFRIDGPNIGGTGVNRVQTNLFNISGRVYTAQIPNPLTLDRTTYARDAASGQVDLFVSSVPTANLVVSGNGLALTTMAEELPSSGKFFAHIPFAAVLPTQVVVTNNFDVPPVAHPVTLVDELYLTQAFFDPATKNLTVKAASRDTVLPLPVLTATSLPAPNTLDATGTLVKVLTTIPPETVTVSSSKGGSATLPVSVVAASPPPAPPTAVNDSASAIGGSTITINVLANDLPGTSPIDPASVQIAAPTGGSALLNANGTVSYTAPTAGGTYTFAYTVKDTAAPPASSNVAIVSITVTGVAPVAVNDSAATAVGTPITINVLANDSSATSTLNPASVVVSITAGNGTAIANATGTVSYTPPAVAGTYSFTYTVQDNALPPRTSAPATVTVTVSAVATPPVAVNDAANTAVNSAVTINVLANDTAGTNAISPASVVIVSAPLSGTALVNLPTGTITYTPALNFSGTTTFTYNVKDTAGRTSNTATVTVTVAAAAGGTIAVSRAQYTLADGSWRVDGTVTPAPPAGTTVTIFNNALAGTAPLVNNVAVGGNGTFTWSSPKPFTAPNAQRRISVQSNQNPATKVENVTVTVR